MWRSSHSVLAFYEATVRQAQEERERGTPGSRAGFKEGKVSRQQMPKTRGAGRRTGRSPPRGAQGPDA